MNYAGQMIRLLVAVAGSLLLSGCVSSILATMAVKAPNQQGKPRVVRDEQYARRFDALYTQSWRVRVGPPLAELAVAVIEPGNYQFNYAVEVKQNERGHRRLAPKMDWVRPERADKEGQGPTVRGTVVVLHGYRDAKENIVHWALYLAQQGYRTVLVDFRGHGRSSGDFIGFGAFEVKDLQQVLDDLQQRGLMGESVGLLGVSYGASMSLLLAAQDPRIAAVVALEPFSNAEKAVVEFAHGVSPAQAAKIGDRTFSSAVTKAAKLGKFSWSQGDVLAAMERVTAPVLFLHGAKDTWLSPENSRALQAKARGPSRLMILPEDDHVWLSLRLGPIVADVSDWFSRYLSVAKTPVSEGDLAEAAK